MKNLSIAIIALTSVSASAGTCDIFVKDAGNDFYGDHTSQEFLKTVQKDFTAKGYHVINESHPDAMLATVQAVDWYVTPECSGAALANIEISDSNEKLMVRGFAISQSCQGWLFARRTLKRALRQIPALKENCEMEKL